MNVKRFTARTTRDALALVRQAFGEDAVVMSTRPCADGVEVLAMAPESVLQIERLGASAERVQAPALPAAPPARVAAPVLDRRVEPTFDDAPGALRQEVREDAQKLEMSTLSFQEYVRERMLRRRQNELAAAERAAGRSAAQAGTAVPTGRPGVAASTAPARPAAAAAAAAVAAPAPIEAARARLSARLPARAQDGVAIGTDDADARRAAPVLRDELGLSGGEPPRLSVPVPAAESAAVQSAAAQAQGAMLDELRSVRGLIEQRFGALAFMEKLQRQPRQAQLSQRLLDNGFSPALVRKLVAGLPADVDELPWAAGVLERNLQTGEREGALEDQGGVYALVGATGVGKTTSTAKLAAAFATRHGASNLGLITLDAYRVAAHEQLRAYGRILGVPVHTAHDRASLEDLLELLSGKRMVLVDTAGMAQRDDRTRDLLEMLSHPSIKRLLVVNASAQGETIEDQLTAYAASGCRGVVLSKVDEAVKLGPALDAIIRGRLKVVAVANGQRVPEDWHRLSAAALVQRALVASGAAAWRLDDRDVNLSCAGLPGSALVPAAAQAARAAASRA
ncbi:MAG: flagellar biosynthesis protein FlhF [Pseudomonadota bacterium]